MLLETDDAQVALAIHTEPPQPPNIQMDVRAQRLAFAQQAATAPPPRPEDSPAPAPPGPTPEAPPTRPTALPVTLNGTVNIAEGRVQHLNFQQMTADFSLVKGLLKSTQQMQLYAGSYRGTAQLDLTPSEPSYTLDATVVDLDVGRAMNELSSVKQVLLGALTTDLRLAGQGLTWDVIKKTLSGDGHVKIADAKLTNFDLIPKLLQVLRHLGGLGGFTIPQGWEQDPFRTVEGDWRLHQGKILTDHLRLRGEGIEALLKGYVGLDETLQYEGNLFLPARLLGVRGKLPMLRQDEAGRVALPFTVQGTVHAPRIAFAEKALVEQAAEGLIEKMRKQLGGTSEGMSGQPSAGDQQSQESDTPSQERGDRPGRSDLPKRLLEELLRR
jgi:hypothetical protein